MSRKSVVPFMLLFFFLGCRESSLNIKITYDQIHGLQKGDRVIFEKNPIGKVDSISYSTEGHYLVDLTIEPGFANIAKENSRFIITKDSHDSSQKVVKIIQAKNGGTPLKNGTIVKGSDMHSAFFQQMGKDLEEGLGDLKNHFEQFIEDLKKIPESDEVKKLEKELESLAEEMKRSGESVRKKIEKDIVPKLRQEIEELRKRLHKLGRDDEIERLDHQMEKIREI